MELIQKYSDNSKIHDYLRKTLIRSKDVQRKNFYFLMMQNLGNIHIAQIINLEESHRFDPIEHLSIEESKIRTFYTHNMSKFEKDYYLKPSVYKEIKEEIEKMISQFETHIEYYDDSLSTEANADLSKQMVIKSKDGEDYFVIDDNKPFEFFRKWFCDERGDNIMYDFNGKTPQKTIKDDSFIQVIEIDILSEPIEFDYPIQHTYVCNKEESPHITKKKIYATTSVRDTIKCEIEVVTVDAEGRERSKPCGSILKPDYDLSDTKRCYYYRMSYREEEKTINVECISFNKYFVGKYLAALYKTYDPHSRIKIYLVDVKRLIDNTFTIPKKIQNENYIFTMQKAIDNYIAQQTGTRIWGLLPVKCALIIQAVRNFLDMKLDANISLIGMSSTGKTTILKRYGFAIYGGMFKSTNASSISIPALRGTMRSIHFFKESIKFPSPGLLSLYRCLHIDEIRENKQLLEEMKTFLLENSYSYDKSDGDGVTHRRISHINISENLNIEYKGLYFNSIKKAYNNFNVQIGKDEKEPWDDTWDLYQPLSYYTNPYLFKAIKEKRDQCAAKEEYWIDGYQMAVHNRFPFYFYLVDEKKRNEELKNIIFKTDSLNELDGDIDLLRYLKNREIIEFFINLKRFAIGIKEEVDTKKVEDILNEYCLNTDIRQTKFYCSIVKISAIINQRTNIEPMDYDILKYIIEYTNRKVDINDTNTYEILGLQGKDKVKEMTKRIENEKEKFGNQLEGLEGFEV